MWQCVVRAVWIGMVLGATLSSPASADGNQVVAQIDLPRQTDFTLARGLGLRPFFRLQNVFFALLSTTELKTLRDGGVSCRIIDDAPSDALYLVGPIESIVSRKVRSTDIERLTEVSDRAIYKSRRPVDRRSLRQSGFIPLESTAREIPLTRLANSRSSVTANHVMLDLDLESLVAEVNQDSLFADTRRLEAFQTRYVMTDSNHAAREWLRQKFQEFGYDNISIQEFPDYDYDFGYGTSANVICLKEGTVEPDKVVIVGAHFDSRTYDGLADQFAPGADNNGSGVAAVLEIARVLVNTPTKKTIIFAALDNGEYRATGAWRYASYLYDNGIDVEFMLELDMIGYNGDAYDGVYFGYDLPSISHLYFMGEMATRYSALYPEFTNDIRRTNNFIPFREFGYRATYVTEYGYNPGWYTAEDLTSAMDFSYLTEVTKLSLATIAGISQMPATIDNIEIGDLGDGQSLRLTWPPLTDPDIVGYRIYYGTVSGRYSDTLFVGNHSTSAFILEGLDDGIRYYAAVIGVDLAGNESIARPEIFGTPRRIPLPPSGVDAETGKRQISIRWVANTELDFSHYRIFRRTVPDNFMLLADNYLQTAYLDSAVDGDIYYEYVIVAVDSDGNASEYSAAVGATAATFDQGVLIIDATPPDPGNPTIAEKEAFLTAIFAGFKTSYFYYDYRDDPLSKSLLGRYEVVFWIGDYSAGRLWNDATEEALRWYSQYNTALVIAGWRVAFEMAGLKPDAQLDPGNLLYDLGGIDHFAEVYEIDYAGLVGENDFPDASLDPAKVYEAWSGKMGWIGTLGVDTTGEIIARFDSESGAYRNEIIGVRRQNDQSKFVFLSTPFYYLKDDGARNIVVSVLGWFGRPIPCACSRIGDCTGDGRIGPADVVYLVSYVLRQSGEPPEKDLTCPVINRGDFDCDGVANIADIVKLVNYVYRSPAPGPCNPCDI